MSPSQVSRCGGGSGPQFAHYWFSINGAATNVLTGVPKALAGASSSYDGLDTAWQEIAGRPAYNDDFVLPEIMMYTATLIVTWPAFTGDRYIEITVTNPVTMLNVPMMPARVRGSVTPDHDIQSVTTHWFAGGAGGFQPLQLNAYQTSGVTQQITPWGFTAYAHVRQTVPDV